MIVGLLGGSFDPLHLGHLMLASSLRWRRGPDALWLLPVAHHVFEKELSPYPERLEMARIGAKLLGPGAEARDDEAKLVAQGGDGSSVALLRHLTAAHPGATFLFAMGADAWTQRDQWKDFAGLQKLAEVVVFNREGSPLVPGGGPPLPAIAATEIRERVKAGKPIGELVPAEVERYIREKGLYR